MDGELETHESTASLATGGLLTILFGAAAVMMTLGIGWAGAAVLGGVLLAVARKVPTESRVLPVILGVLGVAALLGAVVLLVS